MATISIPSLKVEGVNDTTVKVTVKYKLTPTPIERLAHTVFSEKIILMAFDNGEDDVLVPFPTGPAAAAFSVTETTENVQRERTRNVLKSKMNEDPKFLPNGAEQSDEVYATIGVVYAANPPASPALPPEAKTNQVRGPWK